MDMTVDRRVPQPPLAHPNADQPSEEALVLAEVAQRALVVGAVVARPAEAAALWRAGPF